MRMANVKIASFYLLIVYMLFSGWVYANRIRADLSTAAEKNEASLIKASKIDVFHERHLDALIRYYERQYKKDLDHKTFTKLVDSIDLAIERDPLNLGYYGKRAAAFLRVEKIEGIQETFGELLRQNAPRFYLAELKASTFYMDAAVKKTKDEALSKRFEQKAIAHYNQAKKYYPHISKADFAWNQWMYHMATPGARNRYLKLFNEGVIK